MKKEKKKKRDRKELAPPAEPSMLLSSAQEPSMPEDASEGIRCAAELLGGKWTLPVLWALRSGQSLRYGDIRARVPGITDVMLSQTLRSLTTEQLVERQAFSEIPPRVEYRLTAEGTSLLPALSLLAGWGAQHPKQQQDR